MSSNKIINNNYHEIINNNYHEIIMNNYHDSLSNKHAAVRGSTVNLPDEQIYHTESYKVQ